MKKFAIFAVLVAFICFIACEQLSQGLDATFGSGGVVTTAVGSSDDRIFAVALQDDGKIVVAGTSFSTKFDFAIARYNVDGTLDSTFDTDGIVQTSFSSVKDIAYAVAIQSNGKILVAGETEVSSGNTDFILARYLSNGTLDATFGSSGKATKDFGASGADQARALVIDNGGSILVAGVADDGTDLEFGLARYTGSGSPDTSFSSDGFAVQSLSAGTDRIYDVALDSSQKIVSVGVSGSSIAVTRTETNGTLDATFSGDGIATFSASGGNDEGRGVSIRSAGSIVIAGTASTGSESDAVLAQVSNDGSIDLSFGTNGFSLFSVVTTTGRSDIANDVVLGFGDKPTYAGQTNNGSNFDWLLGRARLGGDIDFTFDTDGFFTRDFSNGLDEAQALVLQTDGKIVVVGYGHNGSNHDFALIRFEP